jgi:hypothetical protein
MNENDSASTIAIFIIFFPSGCVPQKPIAEAACHQPAVPFRLQQAGAGGVELNARSLAVETLPPSVFSLSITGFKSWSD